MTAGIEFKQVTKRYGDTSSPLEVKGIDLSVTKGTLTTILTYHVVAGKVDAASLGKMIMEGKGVATFKTVSGGTLTAKMSGSKAMITDEKGGTATVTIADVYQSNGVIHVIDKVLLPK